MSDERSPRAPLFILTHSVAISSFVRLIPDLSILASDLPILRGLNSLLGSCASGGQNVTLFAPTDAAVVEAVQMGHTHNATHRRAVRGATAERTLIE